MLTRQQLEIINRKILKYPLHIAEKDYLLALVMQLIAGSPLGEKLVFKGGTALHHCYLEQYRFSEDLDFSTGQQTVTLKEVQQVLTSEAYLEIKKDFESEATIKIERLGYTGPLGHPNAIKVEIDFLQNVLLPPQEVVYENVWGVEFSVRTMDIREICAEKIRAMSGRARYRDFYDTYLLIEKYGLDLDEVVGYVAKKEIRQPISKASIVQNWRQVSTQKESELRRIYFARKVPDMNVEEMVRSLPLDVIG